MDKQTYHDVSICARKAELEIRIPSAAGAVMQENVVGGLWEL